VNKWTHQGAAPVDLYRLATQAGKTVYITDDDDTGSRDCPALTDGLGGRKCGWGEPRQTDYGGTPDGLWTFSNNFDYGTCCVNTYGITATNVVIKLEAHVAGSSSTPVSPKPAPPPPRTRTNAQCKVDNIPAHACTGAPHKLALATFGMSWTQARDACAYNGMCLCPLGTVCPGGHNTAPFYGKQNGDQWTPVGDDGDNQWVQTGDRWPTCWEHDEIAAGAHCRPTWGLEENRAAFHGPLFCCGTLNPKTPVVSGSSKGVSWSGSQALCVSKGKQLCSFSSLCKEWAGGHTVPVMGVQPGDVWVPIGGEGDNQWLQLGTRWPVCHRHTEIAGGIHGRPGWGLNTDHSGHRGPIYCC